MLLAVEGGGFFSTSASGYSKGLAHLLVGRNEKERFMGVSSWNQYQLVDHGATTGPDSKLSKKRGFRRCTSFVCFGCLSTTHVGPPPHPKVGPSSDPEKGEDFFTDNGDDKNGRIVRLKSSLRSRNVCCVVVTGGDNVCGTSSEEGNKVPCCTERRKVQWTDACGKELAEIREFEPSDMGASDEEFEGKGNQSCGCVIQ